MQLSLSAAAKEVDRSKSTLSRAVKEGRLSDRAESRIAGLLPAPPVRQGRWRLWGRW